MPTDSPEGPSAERAARLTAVLQRAQRLGALGDWPIAEVVDHAREFTSALPLDSSRVLDLGSGAGVPGLVIACDRPGLQLTLVDRRERRTDELARAVASLGLGDYVSVVTADAEELGGRPDWAGSQDAVVARGFADPQTTLTLAARMTRVGGVVIISEPPSEQPSRWRLEWLSAVGVSAPERLGRVVRFHVEHHR
jgi:16S rRNA (guanine527-N7)-methyltransferase